MRIALVSYINTTPFTDGLRASFPEENIQLNLLPPADCAKALANGDADVALIPVGSLPDFEEIEILPNWCIGADGAVESVFIVSERPINDLDTVYLDPHSRSSNGLANILLQYHWRVNVEVKKSTERPFGKVGDRTGAVVIGDQAIRLRHKYPYVYDLSAAWKNYTGMPFAFAVWAAKPGTLTQEQIMTLDQAFAHGVAQASDSAKRWAEHFQLDPDFAHTYLTQHIDFRFDAPKHRAMETYLRALKTVKSIAELYSLFPKATSKVA